MNEAEDNFTLIPNAIDLERLKAMGEGGRVEAENRTWVILRYYASETKGWQWCEFSLIVNCPGLPPHPTTYEFKFLKAALTYLEQLEQERLKNESQ